MVVPLQTEELTPEQAHECAKELISKLERESLEAMTKLELVETARIYGTSVRGTKHELIDILLKRQAENNA